jgi:hypothetical protein
MKIFSIIRSLLPTCGLNVHYPLKTSTDRRKKFAKWDGLNFVSTCRFCGKTIRRKPHGGWKRDWLQAPTTNDENFPPSS